jgi:hypothetical protein
MSPPPPPFGRRKLIKFFSDWTRPRLLLAKINKKGFKEMGSTPSTLSHNPKF